jgi:CheY-like chemotaxis protein
MLLTCPGCSQSFNSREPLRIGEINVSCPNCRASMIVVTAVKIAKAPEAQDRRSLSPERTILVAVEGAATKEMIQEALMVGGYETVLVSTGKEALAMLERLRPSVALLDVGLPEIMGFELCEKIKKSERIRDIKVILVASIYDKKRYKREPDSLYGADDYIERHDIQDRLLSKIELLLGKQSIAPKDAASAPGPVPAATKPVSMSGGPVSAPVVQDMNSMFLEEATVYEPSLHPTKPAPPQTPTRVSPPVETVKNLLEEATVYEPSLHPTKPAPSPQTPTRVPPPVETVKNLLEEATVYEPSLRPTKPEHHVPATPAPPVEPAKNPPVVGDPAKHEAAKRLARLILADIGLYNPKAVEQGVRNNTFHKLLKNELEEGRKLYRSRVSSDIAPDYYAQAIEDFIQKRKGSS